MNLTSAQDSHAQRQYDRWYFGFKAGLDFTTSPPTLTSDGQTMTIEGSASYSDPKTGALLFYTDGVMVWDRQHRLMSNGRDLIGDQSSTQGALIVPDPADQNKYYIFHCDQSGYVRLPAKGVYYSVVDLRLNGGFGDITTKNQQLLPAATEKLTAITVCGGEAYWIVGHEMMNNTFVAWYLDKNGVSQLTSKTPIGNNHGPLYSSGAGYLAASPNGLFLASTITSPASVELFKFNSESGQLQQRILLPLVTRSYGASFSPDNSKLYISGDRALVQFDLSVWDSAAIARSKFNVFSGLRREGALKIGPDGKIYVQEVTHLGVIANPNATGASCNYTAAWLRLRTPGQYGLPNNIDALTGQGCKIPIARIARHETLICEEACTSFKDSSRFAPTSWIWQFEGGTPAFSTDRDPKNICYANAGDYAVKLIVSNEHGIDSSTSIIKVKACPLPVVSLPDTTLCIAECVIFKDTSTLATSWRWTFEEGQPSSHPGKTPPAICYYRPGKHKVTLTATNQYGSSTATSYVTVKDCNLPIAGFTNDTSICTGENVGFTDRSKNVVISREWTFDGGMPSVSSDHHPKRIFYQLPGSYIVRLIASNDQGADTAYSIVHVRECSPPVAKLQDYRLCEGDCVWLQDSSTGDPVYWQWSIDGGSVTSSFSRTPGRVCFENAGAYNLRLISSNAYGSDTANAIVTVTSSKAQPIQSINLIDIAACARIDTAIWITAGCRDVSVSRVTSSLASVRVGSHALLVKANDSMRIPITIQEVEEGTYVSSLSIDLNGVLEPATCTFSVLKAPESFVYSFEEGDFLATHCGSASRELTIRNDACAAQRIKGVRVVSSTATTPFSISAGSIGVAGFSILSNEMHALTISYDATLPGSAEAELIIETSNGVSTTWPLRGLRAELPTVEVLLQQPATTYLDPGDQFEVALAFGSAVGDSAAPEQIDLTMQYNTDVVSLTESVGNSGWSIAERSEANGLLTMKLTRTRASINANDTLARLRFRSYLAIDESTSILLTSIACNARDPSFASCVLNTVASAGGSINVGAGCGGVQLREALNSAKAMSVVVQPNPASRADGAVRLRVHSSATEITPIVLTAEIVDLHGKVVSTMSGIQLTSHIEEVFVDLERIPAGSYMIRTTAGGESESTQLIVY